MVINVLNKKLVRDIRRTWGQALAVSLVILCGTSVYISMAGTHRNLLLTRDTYYREYRLAEFTVMVERAPRTAVSRVAGLPGVSEARGRIVKDVNLDIPGVEDPRFGRIISMPDTAADSPVINGIHMMKGRYFRRGTANDVILSDVFAEANNLEPGSRIHATIDNRKMELRVVGTALSPEYVYTMRNVQDLAPEAGRFGIMWMPESFVELAYGMSDAVNEVVGLTYRVDNMDLLLDDIEALLEPYGVYATLERDQQMSPRFLEDELQGLEVSATVTPAIFLGVAALVLLVLLSRMVKQERTQIGLLKAYGYATWTIAFHYVKYALLLGVAGCLGGAVVGQLFARGMIELYVEFFHFPVLRTRFYTDVFARALLIAAVFSTAGALGAVRRVVRIQPAEAMRPEAPRYGKRTAFERLGFVWRRLSFTWKMIVRNVSRYRFRAGLTVFGVAIASSLLVLGFFSQDAIEYLLDFQFTELQREDVKLLLVTERGKDALREIRRLDKVRHAEPLLEYPFEMRAGWRTKDVGVIGVPRDTRLLGLVDTERREVRIPERGLVLTDRLARDLGVTAGDTLAVKPLKGRITDERPVKVARVVQQYLGISAYMDIETLSRLLDEPLAMNAALLELERDGEAPFKDAVRDVAAITGVEMKEDTYQTTMDTLAGAMRIMNVIMVLFAGAIAFTIIYNSTIVSLSERQRELASLRVMGFTKQEVGRILYEENAMLSVFGLVLGLPLGALQGYGLTLAYDTELYRFPFYISANTYVYSTLCTVAFVVLANLAAQRRVRRLDMIEVLKSRE